MAQVDYSALVSGWDGSLQLVLHAAIPSEQWHRACWHRNGVALLLPFIVPLPPFTRNSKWWCGPVGLSGRSNQSNGVALAD
jgi:hypothetical protein